MKLCPDIRAFPDTIHRFTKPVPRLPERPRPSTDICKPAPIAFLTPVRSLMLTIGR
ncbi:hypothetical protein NP493_246g02061 [Ridgeia piscesae]|uniref:Uncharacterized protein n=1 Tax=Ridgeia piscesae TaxID=27915 RepID=A0AAD9NZ29_RIDPI|nr:hypothetical protein NP493_246g02061 [Ridgeia piscesae]